MMQRTNSFPTILLTAVLFGLSACDRGSAQRDFEAMASLPPSGITETDVNGNIVGNVDPDDWRSAPLFPSVTVQPAFPNPVPFGFTGAVQIEVSVPFRESISGGLELLILDPRQQPRFARLIDRIPSGSVFQINTLSFTRSDVQVVLNLADPAGLYRLYIQDGSGRLVSYGDVQVL